MLLISTLSSTSQPSSSLLSSTSSYKVKEKIFLLFLLLGAALLVFVSDVFVLQDTTTIQQHPLASSSSSWTRSHDSQSQQQQLLFAKTSIHKRQEKQNYRTSSNKVESNKLLSRRLERRSATTSSFTTTTSSGSQQQQQQQQQTDTGAFVHIGKTGGSTISKLLRNGCHSVYPKPCRSITNETIVSQLVSDYYHVPDFRLLPISRHTFYIVSVRDPLDRTISAFVYGHPKNIRARGDHTNLSNMTMIAGQLAYRCFPSLEKWVEHLGDDDSHHFVYPGGPDYLDSRNCTTFARAAIHNRIRFFSHLFFDIKSVIAKIPESNQPTIYAIRQEHLWDDWIHINRLLGQTSDVVIPRQVNLRNVATIRQPVKRTLSDQGRERLCRALDEEYTAYVKLLRRAVNLKDTDVAAALDYSKRQCPKIQIG